MGYENDATVKLPDPVQLAKDLVRETLHGPPPVSTTMALAAYIVTLDEKKRRVKRMPWLLQNIAADLSKWPGRMDGLEVRFYCEDGLVFTFGLTMALDYLANDIYWDERGDWSDAVRAEVLVL